jgi:hypothetical protein
MMPGHAVLFRLTGSAQNAATRPRLLSFLSVLKSHGMFDRPVVEQAHQQLKEELSLDHFEGRSWQGLHRHALMTMIAYTFLQHRRSKAEKRINGPPPQPTLPRRASPRHPRTHRDRRSDARIAESGSATSSGVNKLCQSSARRVSCSAAEEGVSRFVALGTDDIIF